jgi:hypothetical protein
MGLGWLQGYVWTHALHLRWLSDLLRMYVGAYLEVFELYSALTMAIVPIRR